MAAPEGYKALGKVGIRDRGEYSSTATYSQMDAVYHNGSTYLALKDAPSGAPNDDGVNWRYLAKGFTGDMGDSTVAFTTATSRENINTGESVKTVFGKIKKWFADMTSAAFAQIITSNADLMATTVSGYLVDALAVKQGFDAVNSKLQPAALLSETSGTSGSITIDLSPYRFVLLQVIAGGFCGKTIDAPGIIKALTVLGIQTHVGVYSANVNLLYDGVTLTWASDIAVIFDVYGIA